MLTIHPSDLFFKIYKVHHKGDKYVKCEVMYFHKSSGNICYWLNPEGRPKNFKLIRSVYDNYTEYRPEGEDTYTNEEILDRIAKAKKKFNMEDK